jgi:hypothetical protein
MVSDRTALRQFGDYPGPSRKLNERQRIVSKVAEK